MYALYPSDRLRVLREQFPDYAIFEAHDACGRAEFAAVLTQPHRAPGAAVLLCAASPEELRAALREQGAVPVRLVPAQRAASPWDGGGPDAA